MKVNEVRENERKEKGVKWREEEEWLDATGESMEEGKEKKKKERKRKKEEERKEGGCQKLEEFRIQKRKSKDLAGKNCEWHLTLKFCLKFMFDLNLSLSMRNWSLNTRSRVIYDV